MAATKPYRRASEQFNIRVTPEDAALIRAAFPPRTINKVTVELLIAEARARLENGPQLESQPRPSDAGNTPAERRTTEAA